MKFSTRYLSADKRWDAPHQSSAGEIVAPTVFYEIHAVVSAQ